jgi:hypothetical protein
MKRIYVDFNSQEEIDAVVINLDVRRQQDASLILNEGEIVILYDEEMECEAAIRRGRYFRWVACIDRTTIKDLP